MRRPRIYGLPSRSLTHDERVLPWRLRRPRSVARFLSPAVRREAAERGVDPSTLWGSGAGGRVTRADVRRAAVPAARGDEVVPFGTVRRRAAAALLASKHTAAHALVVTAADYSAVEEVRRAARDEWRAREGFPLTYLPFVARAVVDAVGDFPLVNATVPDGHDAPVAHRAVHLGIAVDLDFAGLVVPVVRGADGLRLRAIARAVHDLAARARSRRLSPDDLAGGTFTITNPGAAGTWISFPVLNRPQVAILATDGVAKRVVADGRGRLGVAPVGHLCLAFDHRALDGAYAAGFLERVRRVVEERDWSTEL